MADDIIPLRASYVLSMVERISELEAEIVRLRAAGDALAAALNYWNEHYESAGNDMELLQQWQQARRG